MRSASRIAVEGLGSGLGQRLVERGPRFGAHVEGQATRGEVAGCNHEDGVGSDLGRRVLLGAEGRDGGARSLQDVATGRSQKSQYRVV